MNIPTRMMMHTVVLCICYFVTAATSRKVNSPSECSYDHLQANCKGLHFAEVPNKIHPNTTSLFLDQNGIHALKANNFASTPSLVRLSLTNCGLTTLDDNSFSGLKSLTELRLNNNSIKTLNDSTFGKDLGNLTLLYLNFNKLTKISQHVFDHLVKLQELYLDHNQIVQLHPHAFTKLASIQSISIEFNKLVTASRYWFYPVNHTLSHISLHNNSWICDCRMLAYKTWTSVAHKKFSESVDIICSDKNSTLKKIHAKDLCPSSTTLKSVALDSTFTLICPDTKSRTWKFMTKVGNITTVRTIVQGENVKISSGVLTVMDVSDADAGTYCCTNELGEDAGPAPAGMVNNKHCFSLKIRSTPKFANDDSPDFSASAVVIVILVFTALACITVCFFRRKRRNYGLLNDETIFQPTIDDPYESTHIAERNLNSPTTGEAYV